MIRVLSLLLLAVAVASAAGAAPSKPAPLIPARVVGPPLIDGDLGDAAWEQAPRVAGFKTWRPDFGHDASDQTEVRYAYDSDNLYFAFHCLDREPNKIKASITSRDNVRADDWICINLDTFDDQQALYAFYVNPLGIQGDSRYAAGKEDTGFDLIWYSAGRIDADGYSVEVRIPFKSLRYTGRNPVRMGVIFERNVSRRSEGTTYPALDPGAGYNFLIQTIPIVFSDIKHYTLLEVLPDVTYTRQGALDAGRLATTANHGDLGVSAKCGVTSRLTFDGTYNPDFSQVEADAGQIDINLRYALFFPEKRPFFLEGGDAFNLSGPTSQDPLQAIVHTRTIVNPLAGAKLSGKVGDRETLATLYAADEVPDPSAVGGDRYAHVTAIRYKHSLSQDSYLGGFFGSRERASGFNRVFGTDGTIRLSPSSAIGYHALGSETKTEPMAPRSAGHAVGMSFDYDTRRVTFGVAGLDISPDFVTEVGYLTRQGIGTLRAAATPKFYPKNKTLRRVDLMMSSEQRRDHFAATWEGTNAASVRFMFIRNSSLTFGWSQSSEVFDREEFGTSGVSASASTQLTRWLQLQASVRRRQAIYYVADPFGGMSTGAGFSAVLQASEKLRSQVDVTYADFARRNETAHLYDYTIIRNRTAYQLNRYLFFRGIVEYNSFKRQVLTDFLASFTYIPGTVLHAGYGSLYEKLQWADGVYQPGQRFLESRRGLFFKASYLWRL